PPPARGAGQPPRRPRSPAGRRPLPHDLARTPDSLARRWFTDAEMDRSLDLLAAAQREDGGWPMGWRAWAPGPALEWRPIVTIDALLALRAYGRDI
ncbi:hypothetical protein RKE29_26005, partial [Streptomyces sp. B1866]|nr:hypothetical protein [Streptomyces sp. B1866]